MNADSCNDLAKQGIPDTVRNQTIVDLQTNINETSDDSPKAPPGASEEILNMDDGTTTIKNSTGTYHGPLKTRYASNANLTN